MYRFILPVAAMGAFLAIAQGTPVPPTHLDVPARGHVVLHILTANDDGEAVGEPVTPALVAFRVEAGHVDGAGILECEQVQEMRQAHPPQATSADNPAPEGTNAGTVDYPVVVLNCTNGTKLAVVGLDLTVKK
jgi:hypothetical protein